MRATANDLAGIVDKDGSISISDRLPWLAGIALEPVEVRIDRRRGRPAIATESPRLERHSVSKSPETV